MCGGSNVTFYISPSLKFCSCKLHSGVSGIQTPILSRLELSNIIRITYWLFIDLHK